MFLATFGAYLDSLKALIEGRSMEDAEVALAESLKRLKGAGSSDRLLPTPSRGEATSPYTTKGIFNRILRAPMGHGAR